MKEKISVIVPVYNSEKTLKLCLDSVFSQDYNDYEVIIVDDRSSDNSIEIAKGYKCRVVRLKVNSGPAVARNIGAKLAKGSILFFVDSDVALQKNALSVAVEEFDKNQELGAVCGIYDKEPLIKDSLVEEYRVLQDYYWKKSSEGYVTTLNVADGAIRKKVFDEMNGFNPALRGSEDVEFGNRISEKYKILYTSRIIGKHDCDDKLPKILKNFYKRSKERVPLFAKRKKFNRGYATANRGIGSLLAGFSAISLLLGIINIQLLAIPAFLFLCFLLSDFGLYLFVLGEKGMFFILYFIFIHYLVNLAIFAGIIIGFLQYSLKKEIK